MTRATGMRALRVAMLGQKGLPARYGGVETHVEALATRLAARGHEIHVFCRSRLRPPDTPRDTTWRGVHLHYRPSIPTKHLDAASHVALGCVESALRLGVDIVHLQGIGPAGFAPLARALGARVVSTFHALDWRQAKWGSRARRLLRRGEAAGARRSHAVIAVSRLMQRHVREVHGRDAVYIPNGAAVGDEIPSPEVLARWGLRPGGYVLAVGRIIPDRELHVLVPAFRRARLGVPLVVVGAETPPSPYGASLREMAGDEVIFTGEVFGADLDALYAHCRLYVLASRVEGLPITVCEAMAHGCAALLSDIPENREVGGDAVAYFRTSDGADLERALRELDADAALRQRLGEAARARAREHFHWDAIADAVEAVYYRVLRGAGSTG